MLVRFTSRSYMLVRFYTADLIDCTSYVNEPKIKIGMSSVGEMYVVCSNFKERLKFLIWQPDCRIFSTRATHFGGILCLNISCFHSPLMTL